MAFDPNRPPERELESRIGDGFVLAAVGDCITARPVAPLLDADAGFAGVAARLWDATVSVGNLETSIVDLRGFRGSPRTVDDWNLCAEPAVADDMAALGFDLMSRANNHAMDWGIDGMRETGRRVDEVGIVHAGAGEALAHARAPQYVQTPHGRVGFVSLYALDPWDNDAALDQFGQVPARPGVNGLRRRRVVTLPEAGYAAARAAYRAAYPDHPEPAAEGFTMFEVRWEPGTETSVRYDMDAEDVAGILRAIRLGAQHSDLMVVAIHTHDEGPDITTPPGYLVDLAHAAIEAGADVFMGHGVHRLWPVEFHRGKPILYGLGNFLFSDIAEPMPAAQYAAYRPKWEPVFGNAIPSDADLNLIMNAGDFAGERYFESVVAEIEYEGNAPRVRLHPIDLGYGLPLTQGGIPRVPSRERAEATLQRLADMSAKAALRDDGGIGIVEPTN